MNYRNDNRSGGGRSYNRDSRGGFGGGRDQDRQMFSTRCASCGRDCEVPFKPNGSKPVYCNDCFRTMGQDSDNRSDDRGARRSFGEDRAPRTSAPNYSEQFAALNTKLDKILSMLGDGKTTSKKAKPAKASPVEDATSEDAMTATPVTEDVPMEAATPLEYVAPADAPMAQEQAAAAESLSAEDLQ